MKRNYWPLFFIAIFGFTLIMIIWTVTKAVQSPVIEDRSFMQKYQYVDDNYNEMMTSNVDFLNKYDFKIVINDKEFGLTTEDIKFSQRVMEKYSSHKNLLKVGNNSLKVLVIDKISNEKKEVNINLVISKSIADDSDKILTNENFTNEDKTYFSNFEIKEENNWIITGSFKIGEDIGYLYIKSNAK